MATIEELQEAILTLAEKVKDMKIDVYGPVGEVDYNGRIEIDYAVRKLRPTPETCGTCGKLKDPPPEACSWCGKLKPSPSGP